MSKQEILSIIDLIQNSGSFVNEADLHVLLPRKTEKREFLNELVRLENTGELVRVGNLVIKGDRDKYHRNKEISRHLYKSNIKYLKIFSRLPWVRFISLTGSNAFESCRDNDDIDLFVICAANRLWIVYVMIVLLSKLLNKRPFFCFNYLIDEDNISFSQQSYHNAVQIYKMIPLFNGEYKKDIFINNPWINKYLPNVQGVFKVDDFYRLRPDSKRRKARFKLLSAINNIIYKKYKERLTRKFPQAIDKGILLGKGVAKLHLNDKSTMYDELIKS